MRDTSRLASTAHVLIITNAAFWLSFALLAALGSACRQGIDPDIAE